MCVSLACMCVQSTPALKPCLRCLSPQSQRFMPRYEPTCLREVAHGTPPSVTLGASPNPLPVSSTVVPPAVVPLRRLIPVTHGVLCVLYLMTSYHNATLTIKL